MSCKGVSINLGNPGGLPEGGEIAASQEEKDQVRRGETGNELGMEERGSQQECYGQKTLKTV